MNGIEWNEREGKFLLTAGDGCYGFCVSPEKMLTHLHWGGKIQIGDLPDPDELRTFSHRHRASQIFSRQEYPAWGGPIFTECALKITRPDGIRNLLPVYEKAEKISENDSELLRVSLYDFAAGVRVTLCYRVYRDSPLIDRWSEIQNESTVALTAESMLSACFQMPEDVTEYRLTSLTGRWSKEGIIRRTPVSRMKTVLENLDGRSGPFAMPFFALDDGTASEQSGRIWFGTLQWSGNWKISVEQDGYGHTDILAGIHDFDFRYNLLPGAIFITPVCTFGYTGKGFGDLTLQTHRHLRTHIEPEYFRDKSMPLIANTYASLGVGPEMNEKNTLALAEKAAAIGVELYIFDAGWQKALGDWIPHPDKFPHGIRPVRDRAKELGMKFGVWVEIESVDLDSALIAEHPDWVMSYPGQPFRQDIIDSYRQGRVLLNLGRNDVTEYLFNAMDRLVSENGLDYLKLDMNRGFTTPGWENPPPEGEQSIWVAYVHNLWSIFDRLNRKYPRLLMENCASGNARADWGFHRFFGRMNRSDNQDSLDILKLHEGFSYLHLPKWAGGGCHISDYTSMINGRTIPIRFQACAGMLGSLAIGKNLLKTDDAERAELRAYGELYKKIRETVHLGAFHRLASHFDGPYAVYQYVSQDRKTSAVFFFAHALQFEETPPRMLLRGLNPDAHYRISLYGENPQPEYASDMPGRSGRALEESGIQISLKGDFDAKILYLEQEN